MAKGLETIKEVRLQKLEKLRELEINPYPSKITISGKRVPTSTARDLMGKDVLVAGRIWSIREHGAVAFMDLKDASGVIQILFQDVFL